MVVCMLLPCCARVSQGLGRRHRAKGLRDVKAAVDKKSGRSEKLLAWQVTNLKGETKSSKKHIEGGKDSSVCDDDGLVSLQELGVGTEVQKIERS